MAIIIATIALLLCWAWIEITLYFTNKNAREKSTVKGISYKKFIWILRILIITLFFGVTSYMYFFENIRLQKAIEYCLGIIR
jgi:ABC-type multidrug transport system permease subunit